MNGSRVRDLLLIAGGIVVLTGAIALLNRFHAEDEVRETELASPARRLADFSMKRHDWVKAVVSNACLIDEDPENAHAWFNKAIAQYYLTLQQYRELTSVETGSSAVADFSGEAGELQEKFESSARNCIATLERCMDFARYRNRARANTAYLLMLLDEDDEAIRFLREAVEDGYFNQKNRMRPFSSLRDHREFDSICELESANRHRPRSPNVLPPVKYD